MSIKSKEELMNLIKSKIGEDTSDEAIALIEDVSDTLDSLSASKPNDEDWEAKYKENDAAWRKRYTERFFAGKDEPDEDIEQSKPQELPNNPQKYDDLFSERK